MQAQKTLSKVVTFCGIGVHSGLPVNLTLNPAPAQHGIIFVNPKLPSEPFKIGCTIPEVAMQATVLKQKSWVLSTVEHLLAAIVTVGLDNVLIEIDGFEIPILDGSALPFVQSILDAGLQEQPAEKKYVTPKHKLLFADEKTGRSIEVYPAVQLQNGQYNYALTIEYLAQFDHKLIGAEHFSCLLTQKFFTKEIAPARTFGFLEQLSHVRKHGLAKGASLGNTVVLSNEGFLNEPRFENECIRHKVLDLVGDLGLLGHQIIGTVKACKTGHNFNREVTVSYICHPEDWITL